ncbi:MAG: hypothetical protein QM632_05995 [Micrococcaceae bacterium]
MSTWISSIHIPPITLVLLAITIITILQETELKWSFKGLEIIFLVGIFTLWEHGRNLQFNAEVISYLLISVFTGLFFGTLRSYAAKIYYSDSRQKWYAKGTWLSVAIFLLGFAVNTAIKFTFSSLYHDEAAIIAAASVLHVAFAMLAVKLTFFYKEKHGIAEERK